VIIVHESRLGFIGGVRAGYDVMAGGLLPSGGTNGGSVSLNQAFGNGGVFGLQAGLRFQRRLFLSAVYEHEWGGGGSNTTNLATYYNSTGFTPTSSSSSSTSITTHDNLIALDGAYISNPDGLGIILDIAIAYRAMGLSASNQTFSASYSGAEVILGGGMWIPVGHSVRLVPRIDIAFGEFGSQSITCQGGCSVGDPGGSISSPPLHIVVFLGLGGYFNLDFGRGP
jgi:hypothetical protein